MTHAPPHLAYQPPPAPPPPVAPNGQPLADYGDRAVAFLIDYAILFAVGLVTAIPVVIYQFSLMSEWLREVQAASDSNVEPDLDVLWRIILRLLVAYAIVTLVNLAIYYVYRVEMMFRTGQTVGKRVMKIRVTPLDPAQELTRGMATRRWLVDSVGAQLIPMLFLLDGLWQYWDKPYRQCLHDKFAGTTVVRAGT